ncbi:MAG: DUF3341 domain-containing protein [Armatimonadaceae bacterium]
MAETHADAHETQPHRADLPLVGAEIYGMIAEFDDPDALVAAAHRATAAGYKFVEGYSPFPIHGLAEALEFKDWRLPKIAFFGGIGGMLTGFVGLWYTNVIDYPWNVGGKPLFSWPQFIPIAYECTILFAAGAAFLSQWLLNGYPRPHHPIFNAQNFDRASQDRFFLFIEKGDPKYDDTETANFLHGLSGVIHVSVVEK